MPLVIPIQAVASQQLQVVLNNQNCQIAVYQKEQGVFVDLSADGVDISTAVLALDTIPLTFDYSGFDGNLFFVDTQGSDAPQYTGLGTRWLLAYFTSAELAALTT